MRKYKVTNRENSNLFFKQLKLMFICFLILSTSMNNITIIGDGYFIFSEVNSFLLKEGESGTVLCVHNDYLYLNVWNFSEGEYVNFVRIIDVQQPDNPIIIGSIEFDSIKYTGGKSLVDYIISENIAYMLMELWILSLTRYFLTLVNITDPTNPVLLGSSALIAPYLWGVNYLEILSVYKNYAYVSGKFELLVFDCSNQTLPVKVAESDSTGGDLHNNNDFLYLVSAGLKIFDLTNPVNLVLLGEVNSTKYNSAGSGVYGNYIINAYQDSAIQVYDCTDPFHPIICKDYDKTDWNLYIERNIHDMEIVEDRLFIGGGELYIFDISNPQRLKRHARLNIGNQNISRISVSNNYIYLTILSNIRIYSYEEKFLARNIGIGVSVSLSVVVGVSILNVFVKRKSIK